MESKVISIAIERIVFITAESDGIMMAGDFWVNVMFFFFSFDVRNCPLFRKQHIYNLSVSVIL